MTLCYVVSTCIISKFLIKNEVDMDAPIECPECGATAVDPCQKKPEKQDECIREE